MRAPHACWWHSRRRRPARTSCWARSSSSWARIAASASDGAGELTAFATREAGIHAELKDAGQAVTDAEVAAQRSRDHAAEAEVELEGILKRLGEEAPAPEEPAEPLDEQAVAELSARVERLERRREQLGPVNPLAQQEYAEALAHVEELEGQRQDLETAMRELRALIRETDRQIEQTFEQTFAAASRNFAQLVGEVFPGGTGRLRLVEEEQTPRAVLGGEPLAEEQAGAEAGEDEEELEDGPVGRAQPPGSGDRDHARGEVHEAADAALGRREVDDGARLPVRRVPGQAVPLLHPR